MSRNAVWFLKGCGRGLSHSCCEAPEGSFSSGQQDGPPSPPRVQHLPCPYSPTPSLLGWGDRCSFRPRPPDPATHLLPGPGCRPLRDGRRCCPQPAGFMITAAPFLALPHTLELHGDEPGAPRWTRLDLVPEKPGTLARSPWWLWQRTSDSVVETMQIHNLAASQVRNPR